MKAILLWSLGWAVLLILVLLTVAGQAQAA